MWGSELGSEDPEMIMANPALEQRESSGGQRRGDVKLQWLPRSSTRKEPGSGSLVWLRLASVTGCGAALIGGSNGPAGGAENAGRQAEWRQMSTPRLKPGLVGGWPAAWPFIWIHFLWHELPQS